MIQRRKGWTSQPVQLVGALSGVAAAWSGAIGVDHVSGRIITPTTALSSKASRFGRALCVSGTGSLNRATLNTRQGADLPGAGDFTVAILFQLAQVTNGYAVIGRWNTGGTPGTNDWFLGSSGTGGLSSGEMHFSVEVGSTIYAAADLFAGWNANRLYLMLGRRRGTTIYVDRFDFVAGTWRSSSTTNAGITTINSNSARALKLGELDASASLNADVDMYGAYLFKRSISDVEVDRLVSNFWRKFAPVRIWVPVSAGGTFVYNVSLTESTSPTDALTLIATFGVSASESASATDTVAATATWPRSVTEAASATDVVSALQTMGATVAETVTASDVVTALLSAAAAISEAASAADETTSSLNGSIYPVEVAETATPTDAVAAVAQLVAQVAEAASAGDSYAVAQSLVALLTEAGSASDVVSVPGGYSVSITEAATALDVVLATIAGTLTGTPGFEIAAARRRLEVAAARRRLEIRR